MRQRPSKAHIHTHLHFSRVFQLKSCWKKNTGFNRDLCWSCQECRVGCISAEHVSQIVLTWSVLIKGSWLRSLLPWTRSNTLACWQSTKQRSCSAGHLHVSPVCCSWSTEGQKIGLVGFFVCFARRCTSEGLGTDRHSIFDFFFFYLTEKKHHLISKETLFKYSIRCDRHPTKSCWWHPYSGNVEQWRDKSQFTESSNTLLL